MPAAAVIPAPIAYTKVVAVKKLVVGFLCERGGRPHMWYVLAMFAHPVESRATISLVVRVNGPFTLRKIECSKQANALNNLAWNNDKGLRFYFVGVRDRSND